VGALTTTADNKLLDHVLLTTSYTPSTPLKLALMTTNGSAGSAGTEATGGSYSRQTIAFSAASSGSAGNSGTVTFSSMPGSTIVGLEIYDSAGSPVRLFWGALTVSKVLASGDSIAFPAGSIILSLV
jgi:hypothetical protein